MISTYSLRQSGKSVIVDKVTPYPGTSEFVVEQIREFFPSAKIIQLVRDGRDVVTSGAFDWLLKDAHASPRYRYFVAKEPGYRLKRFFDDRLIRKWARHWKETLDVFATDKPSLSIQYETMLAEHPTVLQEIFAGLGVDAANDVAKKCADAVTFENQTGRKNGVMEPTSKRRYGKSGDWKNYMTKKDGELFHALAGQRLIEYGYETDASWVTDLPTELEYLCLPNSDGTIKS